ncbi:hypothetical protein LPJ53_005047 [Coemansia erecta]|uniref:SET domain-containing protein n=1 Tax=Coemansia erecta TaxID=147472 RepID=A0A9W7XT79_9FUNG|nr:hypothetical protein LPJ53_005047 [Coemansia erecta]
MPVDPLIDKYLSTQGICLLDDATTGRRAVATRSLERGSVILSLPPLYLLPLRDGESDDHTDERAAEHPPSRCTNCLDPLGPRRARCSQCHAALYCSAECLAAHWRLCHHLACSVGGSGGPVPDGRAAKLKPAFRATLRMLVGVDRMLTCISQAADDGSGSGSGRRVAAWMLVQVAAWRRLQTHRAEHPAYVVAQYEEIAGVAQLERSSEEETLDMLCRFGCNNFAAYDWRSGVQAAGQVCSPLASLAFNHSCRPTALAYYEPRARNATEGCYVVRALTDVQEGDEVTLAYVDALHPRALRSERLEAVYFFTCRCTRCASGGDNDDDKAAAAAARVDALLDRVVPADRLPEHLPVDLADTPRGPEPWAAHVVDALLGLVLADGRCAGEPEFERLAAECIADTQPHNVSFAAYRHWLECQDDCLERMSPASNSNVALWACVAAQYVLAFYALAYRPFHPLVGRQCLRLAQTVWAAVGIATPEEGAALKGVVGLERARRLCRAAESIVRTAACEREAALVVAHVRLLRDQIAVFEG